MSQSHCKGFSLLELIITVAIVSSIAFVAIPGMNSIHQSSRSKTYAASMIRDIYYARAQAITNNQFVTLCGSGIDGICDKDWSSGHLIFTDANANGVLDDGEVILRKNFSSHGGRVSWRSFQNKPYLQYRPSGFSHFQSGSFIYCPSDGSSQYAKRLVLNRIGRIRSAVDTDNDGIVEDSAGDPIICGLY